MANFSGQNIKDSYESILNLGEAASLNQQIAAGCKVVTDGRGNKSALFLAACTCNSKICGSLNVSGSLETGATFCAPSIIQTSSSGKMGINGDLFVGEGSSREFSVDNTTGLEFVKGKAHVGEDFSTSTLTFSNKGTILSCGSIFSCNDIVAFTSSDKNLKTDLNKIETSKDILNGLNGYSFTWKEGFEREGKDLGVVAQEVQKVLPEIVRKRTDGHLSVDYIKLIPVLIEEVKRLSKEVDELKKA